MVTVLLYPLYAVTSIGLVVTSARDRAVGSPWIAWIGVLGLASHGLAPLLVLALPYLTGIRLSWAGLLFPGVLLFCLWSVLAGLWPVRGEVTGAARAGSGG